MTGRGAHMKYHKVFSYYGGKSKIAAKYPAPTHDLIVEPFAGGACYSLEHCEHDVILNDKNSIIVSVWEFLTSPDALEIIHRHVPTVCPQGINIEDFVDTGVCPEGLINLIRAEFNRGTLGAKGIHKIATKWAARDWHQVIKRLDYWVPRIAHWAITSCDYTDLDNWTGTWFIDPPYANLAGSRYLVNDVNYDTLAEWCLIRNGSIIVCENDGASWLPFEPLCQRAGCFTGRDHRVESSGREVVYCAG